MKEEAIGFFISNYDVLSPFAAFPVEWRGKTYATAEHAYQAAHFFETSEELAEQVRLQPSPLEAFNFANEHADTEDKDWATKKLEIMEEITRIKLDQYEIVREILLETGERQLVETNDEDAFWGWGSDHNGSNELGKIWMKLRSEYVGSNK